MKPLHALIAIMVAFTGSLVAPAATAALTLPTAPIMVPASPRGSVVTTAVLNRWVASTGSSYSGTIPKGVTIWATGVAANGRLQVSYGGRLVWVTAKYTRVPAATPAPAKATQTRVATATLNRWYTSSSRTYSGTVPKGTKLSITGGAVNGRYPILINGTTRWVTGRYTAAANTTATSAATSLPAVKGTVVTTAVLNRWKASTGSTYSGTIAKGVKINHTGVSANGRLQVIHNGQAVWVTQRYTTSYATTSTTSTSNTQWGTCGAFTLDGAAFPAGKVTASVGRLVTVNGTGGSYARVTLWTRTTGKFCSFTQALQETGRVGYGGIVADAVRKQGTGTTPAGIYTMTQGFSNGSAPSTKLAWQVTDGDDYWVQDNDSAYYNTYRTTTGGFNTAEAERLQDYGSQYRYSVVIDFNTAKTRGKGAGIFLHVNGSGATAGCVSVSNSMMQRIANSIAPGDLINIVQ